MNELEIQNAIVAKNITISEDAVPILKRIGRIETLNDLKNFADVVNLQEMAKYKESKEYQQLKGISGVDFNGNKIPDVGTWDGFCRACGYNGAGKVDEDIKYIQQYGYERYLRLKEFIGYRGLRSLNYQSEEVKAEIGEIAEKDDTTKEDLIDKLEDLTAKHAKEKEALQAQLKRKSDDYEAQAKMIATKNERINHLDLELAKKTKAIETQTPEQRGGVLREEAAAISYKAEAVLRGQVFQAFEALTAHTEATGIDHKQFMSGVLAEYQLILSELKERFGLEDAPSGEALPEWAREDYQPDGKLDESVTSILDEIERDAHIQDAEVVG